MTNASGPAPEPTRTTEPTGPEVDVVLLSMGNRPQELAHALQTLHQQTGVRLNVVLVGNGWRPTGVPDWVHTTYEPENLGCPGGRNVGAALGHAEYILFYDDDASLPAPDVVARMVEAMQRPVPGQGSRGKRGVAVVQGRGVDPDGRPTPRRWVPRLRTDHATAGDSVVFWEAISLIRREAFEQVGGWAGEFFFGHEGVDLSMRLLDAGWTIRYQPEIEVCHPATTASRHPRHYFHNARNRVWVARRNLPAPLVPIYLATWLGATIVRTHRWSAIKPWLHGLLAGWREPLPGQRRPISWSTVWTMTRLGRPPLW